jgi:hypothetical protein
MNTKNKPYEPKYAARNGAAIKTVSLQVAVTEPDLQNAVREAFNLAKSGGRELNLAFSIHARAQSNIGSAQFVSPRAGC